MGRGLYHYTFRPERHHWLVLSVPRISLLKISPRLLEMVFIKPCEMYLKIRSFWVFIIQKNALQIRKQERGNFQTNIFFYKEAYVPQNSFAYTTCSSWLSLYPTLTDMPNLCRTNRPSFWFNDLVDLWITNYFNFLRLNLNGKARRGRYIFC